MAHAFLESLFVRWACMGWTDKCQCPWSHLKSTFHKTTHETWHKTTIGMVIYRARTERGLKNYDRRTKWFENQCWCTQFQIIHSFKINNWGRNMSSYRAQFYLTWIIIKKLNSQISEASNEATMPYIVLSRTYLSYMDAN